MRVSRGGYYAFVRRRRVGAPGETRLRVHVNAVSSASQKRDGSPRVHAELHDQGVRTSNERTACDAEHLPARRHLRSRWTTDSRHTPPVAPDRVLRGFRAEAPKYSDRTRAMGDPARTTLTLL